MGYNIIVEIENKKKCYILIMSLTENNGFLITARKAARLAEEVILNSLGRISETVEIICQQAI
ncbi:MAG TPA: hypothetical protein ENG95_06480 [Nitrospirae bacterium]|nr:hypothetical protein BMS3Abin10_01897 [bacterium BMS3Abin10]GBE38249.1 hypothetical protein BMS3Bbin08_00852 [bacterium BMS3Bbin08]HDH50539.1 hypothetical protein [Nitrospirota bacterium]HDK17695.1 hypothetical protein [Nitrospirota bacterium]HDO26270.1 hypothetical protein [Nitrospirota bacterium]